MKSDCLVELHLNLVAVVSCLHDDQLRWFHLRTLPEGAIREVYDHLEACPACARRLESLEGESDCVLELLRLAHSHSSVKAAIVLPGSGDNSLPDPSGDKSPGNRLSVEPDSGREPMQLGDYCVLEQLDAGGMGRVFKARHIHMHRIVALKIMNNLDAGDAVARFQREIQLSAQLVHPNIVTAFDAGRVDDDSFYLVMEFVDGTNLSNLVKENGPLPVDQAVPYVLEAADALAYLERKKIVHRDVKPHNLMLTDDGEIKLLDMGIARRLQLSEFNPTVPIEPGNANEFEPLKTTAVDSAELTSTNAVIGSTSYMAPEQASSPGEVDHRADIYSLGCTMYFLLTGEPPYEGEDGVRIVTAHRDEPVPSPREIRPDLPQAIDAVCRRAMAEKPEDRFQSFADMIDALQSAWKPRSPLKRRSIASTFILGCLILLGVAIHGIGGRPAAREFPKPTRESRDPDFSSTVSSPAAQDEDTAKQLRIAQDQIRKERQRSDALEMLAVAERHRWEQLLVQIESKKGPRRFDAETAKRLQTETAKRLGLPVEWTNEFGMEFVLLPAGTAEIYPNYTVTLTKPYYLGKYEVTVAQFGEFVRETNYITQAEKNRSARIRTKDNPRAKFVHDPSASWRKHRFPQSQNEPVLLVTWNDTQRFVRWLGERNQQTYRLPTLAEWEWGHAAGVSWRESVLDDPDQLVEFGWFLENSGYRTRPVGMKGPNPFGLYDTFGNVSEWVSDWMGKSNPIGRETDPTGPAQGAFRRIAGGGNFYSPKSNAGGAAAFRRA